MLEYAELDQAVVFSEMVRSTECKVIDKNVEVVEMILYHNKKDIPMHGVITEARDDVNKVMGEVSSILT